MTLTDHRLRELEAGEMLRCIPTLGESIAMASELICLRQRTADMARAELVIAWLGKHATGPELSRAKTGMWHASCYPIDDAGKWLTQRGTYRATIEEALSSLAAQVAEKLGIQPPTLTPSPSNQPPKP